ncbi:MAG: TonB-dependent receptor [Pseudomonadota bacterium]
MRFNKRHESALLAGASVLALGLGGATAHAQDAADDDDDMMMGKVVVTTQKTEESILDVPIAVSAFDDAALERLQLAGGRDLVKSVPNVSFTKSNFTGFNFKIRGIGADLIATSGDAGVGIHQNDVPLTANRLFEAEFYDIERVEVLRGPQGTLYGRNATGGVVNVITAKPVLEEFSADVRLEYGNFDSFKAKGFVNVPLGDMFALRVAGSYLTRDGFAFNTVLDQPIDGRDLWSVRGTLAFEPTDDFRAWVSVEHFEEDDNRLRSGKQLCAVDPFETSFMGIPIDPADQIFETLGCQEAPLSESFDRVNSAATLGGGLGIAAGLLTGNAFTTPLDPNLRNIESAINPSYEADQTLITGNIQWDITDSLTITSLTSYNESSIVSIEDYNKIAADIPFNDLSFIPPGVDPGADLYNALFPGGVVADPQLGTSNLFRTFDLSGGNSEQFSQELRIQSNFDGPINFNLGGIYLDFETGDPTDPNNGYYVFSNTLSGLAQFNNATGGVVLPFGGLTSLDETGDGNPPVNSNLNGLGRNYFRSISPYTLESFAIFGEAYIDITDTLTFTGGIRYTDDSKEQGNIPTYLFFPDALRPDPIALVPVPGADDDAGGDGTFNADFQEVTGRATLDWSPDLAFTEDSLFYASYARGYKGGGINPPQPADNPDAFEDFFEPEFINAYEIGTKNTFDGGRFQLNATGFIYDYTGYQITQIINRTSANFNIDATIRGLEFESVWNPASTLLLTANIGYLTSSIRDAFAIDVLDRPNGRDDIVVLKNAIDYSNCAVSAEGYAAVLGAIALGALPAGSTAGLCTGAFAGQEAAFGVGTITFTNSEGQQETVGGLTPFDGEAVSLDGNDIPGAPNVTLSIGAEYTWENITGAWNATLRGDFYYQGDSFSRVWNTGRDVIDSWTNTNVSLVVFNEDLGLEIEGFAKNVTDEEVITGAYLTDDSSGLFTNIFLNEPRTYGVAVRKRF